MWVCLKAFHDSRTCWIAFCYLTYLRVFFISADDEEKSEWEVKEQNETNTRSLTHPNTEKRIKRPKKKKKEKSHQKRRFTWKIERIEKMATVNENRNKKEKMKKWKMFRRASTEKRFHIENHWIVNGSRGIYRKSYSIES